MARGSGYDKVIETRARELASTAGHDPDERAAREGAKPWPRWCEFRDAARAALDAEQAAVVTSYIAPQPDAYADSHDLSVN